MLHVRRGKEIIWFLFPVIPQFLGRTSVIIIKPSARSRRHLNARPLCTSACIFSKYTANDRSAIGWRFLASACLPQTNSVRRRVWGQLRPESTYEVYGCIPSAQVLILSRKPGNINYNIIFSSGLWDGGVEKSCFLSGSFISARVK